MRSRNAVNQSCAARPLPATPGTRRPLPSQATIRGAVVATSHGDHADCAAIFAADTTAGVGGVLTP